ncbi:hypothetical protein CPWG_00032 [Cyanophage MED4-117]|uniref:hypothetical protein n=1 Tax=Cyanophage MED4-117 TaxID=889954 RepID=UPI0002C141EA|nr:hypothetical protein CPWG_00032 [Cyanophage MED4-117]AGH16143.1 hypothetical protein CPWG_00032 [Cyanophage MED4-117]
MPKKMTKAEAVKNFRQLWKDHLKGSRLYYDTIAKREAFNDYTDTLCKQGLITLKQYENWGQPF